MATTRIIETMGSISKVEKLKTLDNNILENTLVLEEIEPFPGYHGANLPTGYNPRAIYLVNKKKHSTVKILRMTQEIRKYGVEATFVFPLTDRGTLDLEATPVTFEAGDTTVIKDEGAAANCDNAPAHEGFGIYSMVLTATEMSAARLAITLVDQTGTKIWEDHALIVTTYGHASSQHAFDLDTATQTVAAMGARIQGT